MFDTGGCSRALCAQHAQPFLLFLVAARGICGHLPLPARCPCPSTFRAIWLQPRLPTALRHMELHLRRAMVRRRWHVRRVHRPARPASGASARAESHPAGADHRVQYGRTARVRPHLVDGIREQQGEEKNQICCQVATDNQQSVATMEVSSFAMLH